MPWSERLVIDCESLDGWGLPQAGSQPAPDYVLNPEWGQGGIPSPGAGTFIAFVDRGTGGSAGSYVVYNAGPVGVRPGDNVRLRANAFVAWAPCVLSALVMDDGGNWVTTLNAVVQGQDPAGWVEIEGHIAIPSRGASILVQLSTPNGTIGFDDIRIDVWEAEVVTGTGGENLLRNGGFREIEPASGGNRRPRYWTCYTAPGLGQMALNDQSWGAAMCVADGDTDDPALIGRSLICDSNGPTATLEYSMARQRVPVIAGRQYAFSAVLGQTGGSIAHMEIAWKNALGVNLPEGVSYLGNAGTYNGWDNGNWNRQQTVLTAPPGAVFCEVSALQVSSTTERHNAVFDQFAMYEGAEIPEWENTGELDLATRAFPALEIDGMAYTHLVKSASWALGRSWWFAGPEPGLATIELAGDREEIRPGARLRLYGAKHPPYSEGGLFTGVVDDVTMDETIENGKIVQRTRITVADQMSWCARASTTEAMALPVQTFDGRIFNLANLAGLQGRVSIATMPAATQPGYCLELQVRADERRNILDLIDAEERYANTILQMDGDGRWRAMKRCAQGSFVSVPFALEGDSCPSAAHLDRQSTDKAINRWTFSDGTEAWPSAVDMFGAAEYGIPYTRNQASYRYPGSMREKVAVPVFGWVLTIPIRSRSVGFTRLGPFDYVLWRGKQYQVMNIAYNATPGSWQAVVGLGPTQGYISGGSLGDEVAPPPEIPPEAPPPEIPDPELPPEWFPPDQPPEAPPEVPNPPAPTRKRATVNAACTKDAYVALTAGGLNAGNGAGSVVLVGRLTDGTLCRGLFGFAAMSFLGSNRTVVSATLTLTTRRGSCMSWGSSPHVRISRMTSSWSEGSYNASSGCGFAEANAVKWPGGTATSAGQVTKAHSASDGIKVSARIDEIAQAWLSGQPQYGVRLSGYNDDNSANRSAFAADSTATLQVVYDYDE